jgi:hypothetical protein
VWYQYGGWFPNVPVKQLREVTRKIPEVCKPHPVIHFFADVPTEETSGLLQFPSIPAHRCARYDASVTVPWSANTVQVLILHSSQPDVVCCEAPNYHGVETEEHLFLSCGRVGAIWHSVLPGWQRIIGLALGSRSTCYWACQQDVLRLPS